LARIVNLAHDDKDVNVDEKDRSKPRAYLKLIDANSEEDIDIGEELIKRGYAVNTINEN